MIGRHRATSIRIAFLPAAAAGLLLVMACSGSSGDDVATARVEPQEVTEVRYERPDNRPLLKGPVSADGLQAILGTADLGIGTNRVGLALASEDGLVREPTATIRSYFAGGGDIAGSSDETQVAQFFLWPYGTRGLYTTTLTFDRAGEWLLDISVRGADGEPIEAQLTLEVRETASAPAVGSPAVRSANKTVDDVENLSQLTTGSLKDPELYQTTIADAIDSGLPTVIVFASPAFCTNAVCGPQVDVLQQLKNAYQGRANFIHVDFYDNPHVIQGDLDRAIISPTVVEWALPSTEWTFVVGRDGLVSARFEAFATFQEVEAALKEAL